MFDALIKQTIIVETDSFFTYIGTLSEATGEAIRLSAVTIYDERHARVSQERFLVEVASLGNTASREEIYIRQNRIVAVSPLSGIILPG
jgi:small nuclear ribonucleoprotein (snRNP)-like protein